MQIITVRKSDTCTVFNSWYDGALVLAVHGAKYSEKSAPVRTGRNRRSNLTTNKNMRVEIRTLP